MPILDVQDILAKPYKTKPATSPKVKPVEEIVSAEPVSVLPARGDEGKPPKVEDTPMPRSEIPAATSQQQPKPLNRPGRAQRIQSLERRSDLIRLFKEKHPGKPITDRGLLELAADESQRTMEASIRKAIEGAQSGVKGPGLYDSPTAPPEIKAEAHRGEWARGDETKRRALYEMYTGQVTPIEAAKLEQGRLSLGEARADVYKDVGDDILSLTPFISMIPQMKHDLKFMQTVDHVKRRYALIDEMQRELEEKRDSLTPKEIAERETFIEDLAWDVAPVEKMLLEKMRAEHIKDLRGGPSMAAQIVATSLDMPVFMAEILLTGGIYAGARGVAAKGAAKVAGKYAQKKAVQVAAKVAGAVAGSGARALAMPGRVGSSALSRQMPQIAGVSGGRLAIEEAEEHPATSLFMGWTDVGTEVLSEVSGEATGAALQAAGKAAGAASPSLRRAMTALRRGTRKAGIRIPKTLTAAGYHGILEEMGEERLADVLNVATGVTKTPEGVSRFDAMLDAMVPSSEQALVELAAFSVPGAVGMSANAVNKWANTPWKPPTGKKGEGAYSKDLGLWRANLAGQLPRPFGWEIKRIDRFGRVEFDLDGQRLRVTPEEFESLVEASEAKDKPKMLEAVAKLEEVRAIEKQTFGATAEETRASLRETADRKAEEFLGLTPQEQKEAEKPKPVVEPEIAQPAEAPQPTDAPEVVKTGEPEAETPERPQDVPEPGAAQEPAEAEKVAPVQASQAEQAVEAEPAVAPEVSPEPAKAKKPWEMTSEDYAFAATDNLNAKADAAERDGLIPYVTFLRKRGGGKETYEAIGRDGEVLATGSTIGGPRSIAGKLARRKGIYSDIGNVFWTIPEGAVADWSVFAHKETQRRAESHRNIIRYRVEDGKPVPRAVLEDYRGEKWADAALAKMEGKPATGSEQAVPVTTIGETRLVAGVESALADTATIDGVHYELYRNARTQEGPASIRVVDVDAGEVVSLKKYKTYDQAETAYKEAVSVLTSKPKPKPAQSPESKARTEEKPKKSILSALSQEEQQKAEELKRELREILSRKLTGLDADAIIVATKLGGLYVKAGAKTFAQWVKNIASDLGPQAEQLSLDDWKSIYSATRYQVPESERAGLTPPADLDAIKAKPGQPTPNAAAEDSSVDSFSDSQDDLLDAIAGQGPLLAQGRPNEPVGVGDIVKAMGDLFEVVIRVGRYRGGASGIYKRLDRIVRVKRYGDFAVAAHEVAHFLHRTGRFDQESVPSDLLDEVRQLDYDYPEKSRFSEGFAEFVRMLWTGEDAQQHAPNFYEWFVRQWLPASGYAREFASIKSLVRRWVGQGPVQRGMAQVEWKHKGRLARLADYLKHPVDTWYLIRAAADDRMIALWRRQRQITGTKDFDKVPAEHQFATYAKVSSMTASAKARQWILHGTTDKAGNKTGKGVVEILSPIADGLRHDNKSKEFQLYCYARHALDVLQAGKDPGLLRRDAIAIVKEYGNRPGWEQASNELTAWFDRLLDYLIDAGGLAPEAKPRMREMYPHYVPLLRSMEEEMMAIPTRIGGRKIAGQSQPIRRLKKGSKRKILPPLESAAIYAELIIGTADKIRVGKMMVSAARAYRSIGDLNMGNIVEQVAPERQPHSVSLQQIARQLEEAGAALEDADMEAMVTIFANVYRHNTKDNVLVLWEKGKKKVYQVAPDLYRAMMAVDETFRLPEPLRTALGAPARLLRLTATGLRPGFSLVTNPLRDTGTSILQTRAKGAVRSSLPSVVGRNIQGFFMDMVGDDVVRMWRAGGGEMAQPLGIDRRFSSRIAQEALAVHPSQKVLDWSLHPIEAARNALSVTEAAPRIAEFKAVLEDYGWKPGQKVTFQQFLMAQMSAANVTVDFREGGWLAMWANRIVPFFNAQIQGPKRMLDQWKRHPAKSLARAVSWLTIPSLLLWWMYKDEEWYKQLPGYEKARYWHVKLPNGLVIRVPKPFEWGMLFGSLPESVAESMYRQNPEPFKEMSYETASGFLPPVVPTAVGGPMEVIFNWDMFRWRPVESESFKYLPPEERYYSHTSRLARVVGEMFDVSPIRVEHLVDSYTAGSASDLVRAAEQGLGHAGVIPKAGQRPGTPTDIPVVGRLFLRETATRVFDDFYGLRDAYATRKASMKKAGTREPFQHRQRRLRLQRAARDLAEERKKNRVVVENASMSQADKRVRLAQSHRRMIAIAKKAMKGIK